MGLQNCCYHYDEKTLIFVTHVIHLKMSLMRIGFLSFYELGQACCHHRAPWSVPIATITENVLPVCSRLSVQCTGPRVVHLYYKLSALLWNGWYMSSLMLNPYGLSAGKKSHALIKSSWVNERMHGNEYKLLIRSICKEFTFAEKVRHEKRKFGFLLKDWVGGGTRLGIEIIDVATRKQSILNYVSGTP